MPRPTTGDRVEIPSFHVRLSSGVWGSLPGDGLHFRFGDCRGHRVHTQLLAAWSVVPPVEHLCRQARPPLAACIRRFVSGE